jgi:hypothetical protein
LNMLLHAQLESIGILPLWDSRTAKKNLLQIKRNFLCIFRSLCTCFLAKKKRGNVVKFELIDAV